jgi:hypothetical protein
LTLHDEKDGARRRKAHIAPEGDDAETVENARGKPDRPGARAGAKAASVKAGGPEVGHALRTVYQRTIDEDIPPEMLDLLGKLG